MGYHLAVQARKIQVAADPWKWLWCYFGIKRLAFHLSKTENPPKFGGDAYVVGGAEVAELNDKLAEADKGSLELLRERENVGATLRRDGDWIYMSGSFIGDSKVRFPLAFLRYCIKKSPVATAGNQMTIRVRELRPAQHRYEFTACCEDAEEAWKQKEFLVRGGKRLHYGEGERILDCPFCLAEIVFKWSLE